MGYVNPVSFEEKEPKLAQREKVPVGIGARLGTKSVWLGLIKLA